MSISNPCKTIQPARIGCQGTAEVTLGFDAAAGLAADPADIVLIMDRSCSMDLSRMFNARKGARNLLRTVTDASAPAGSSTIGNGTRIGLVSFATTATQDVQLTHDLRSLITGIAVLARNGDTNHTAAFEAAERMLQPSTARRRIAVMFTDGLTTAGGNPLPVTARMKAAGIEIYCIGLTDDPAILRQWASAPLNTHVTTTTDEKQLDALFHNVASQVSIPGARNIVIREQVSPDFMITAVRSVSQGTARILDPRNLIWTMDTAGITLDPAPVTLVFEIRHTAAEGGIKAFNQSITYEDLEGSTLTFPSPTVTVDCGSGPVYPEPCPAPTAFTLLGCQDSLRVRLTGTHLLSLGRIVQLDVTLKDVCPGKRVAVSVILSEVGPGGELLPRGVKHLLVPAQEGAGCRDVELGCIPFSLPEALNPNGNTTSICPPRSFQARVIANYVDTDFTCCEDNTLRSCSCTLCGDPDCPACPCAGRDCTCTLDPSCPDC